MNSKQLARRLLARLLFAWGLFRNTWQSLFAVSWVYLRETQVNACNRIKVPILVFTYALKVTVLESITQVVQPNLVHGCVHPDTCLCVFLYKLIDKVLEVVWLETETESGELLVASVHLL